MRIASLFKLSSAAFLSSAIGAASMLASSTVAHAKDQFFKDGFLSEVNWQVEPYIGADAMTRVMRYKDEPTHPFQEHLDTFQPFVGVRLHKYFGIEAGYQQSEKGFKDRFFDEAQTPEFFGGGAIDLSNPITLDVTTTTIVKGWNFNLIGFYPICEEKTSLFLKVGYADLDVDQEIRFIASRASRGIFQNGLNRSGTMDFVSVHDSTGMLSLVLGIKHDFSRHFVGRIFVGMDRTSRIDLDGRVEILNEIDPNRGGNLHISPHNAFNFGLGAYYTWR